MANVGFPMKNKMGSAVVLLSQTLPLFLKRAWEFVFRGFFQTLYPTKQSLLLVEKAIRNWRSRTALLVGTL